MDADGKTGDGAGIQVEIPQAFFAEHVADTGHSVQGHIAVGQIFLPRTDLGAQERARVIVEREILGFGYRLYGWRQVPTDTSCLGQKASAVRPEIEQVMIQLPVDADLAAVERDMYIIRRRIEAAGRDSALTDLYVCSLSTRSLVYKGMFLAEDLTTFYPDLLDRRFESSFALYHQRYSTNTFPTWWLAQPFRMAAHNGEINTIKGNENWMSCHETRFEHPDLDPFLDDIRPVIAAGSSDTAALDNAFETVHVGPRITRCQKHPDPRSVDQQQADEPETQRFLRLLQQCDGAMGWTSGDSRRARRLGPMRFGSQWPAPHAL